MNPERPSLPGEAPLEQPRTYSFFEKLGAVLFCIFCLEVGIFLLFFPWIDALWSRNWFFHLKPELRPFLMSQYFRGAVGGLGVLNLFIAISEIIRLRRFSRR
jgi:hypothetical protein